MLKFKTLTFQNIGLFVTPQTVEIDKLGRLVQIEGKNLNTGGSSGAAKTTIFNAIDFLFGLNDISNSDLQSRLTKDSISVSGLFDYDGKILKITRGKKLVIEIDGETTTGSSKIAEEKLDQILGVSRELFRAMLHKRQKEGGFFLDLKPGDTYDFLTDCLGLKEMRMKAEIAESAASEFRKQLIVQNTTLESAKAAVEAINNALLALGDRPAIRHTDEELSKLYEAARNASYVVDNLNQRQIAELAELEKTRPVAEVDQFDGSKLEALYQRKKALEDETSLLRVEEVKIAAAQKEISHQKQAKFVRQETDKKAQVKVLDGFAAAGKRANDRAIQIATEIKAIRAQTCFTCHQTWTTETAKKKERDLLAELADVRKVMQEGTDASIKAELLLSEIAADRLRHEKEMQESLVPIASNPRLAEIAAIYSAVLADIKNEADNRSLYMKELTAKNEAKMKAFVDSVNKMKNEHARLIGMLLEDHRQKDSAHKIAMSNVESDRAAVERYEKSTLQMMRQHEAAVTKLSEATNDLVRTKRRSSMADEARRAIKEYTSRQFDGALQVISENATKTIRQIPNMRTATVEISATKETGDGRVKEEVNKMIHMNGEEKISIKTLSGGERTSADLAVDLAVMQFAEETAGKGIDLFLLDEPFTGLEAVNIEAIVEMLKVSSLTKRIMVVDHNPIIAETFESKLLVQRNGSSSFLLA
jgi:alpha-D-ribose 1-methylphosphonate 5-triphosphate synthase subunit PhnL